MKHYTVIDLEWTSWKNNYYGKYLEKEKREKWQKREIIQIGAIKFDKNYNIKDKLNVFVKPEFNLQLSTYIIRLTSITNKLLEKKGINFIKAFRLLKRFSKKTYIFCNGSDGSVLRENLDYRNLKINLPKIKNIKSILQKKYKVPKKYLHSPKLKTYYGYSFNPKIAHHALHDCKSILVSMKKMSFNLKLLNRNLEN